LMESQPQSFLPPSSMSKQKQIDGKAAIAAADNGVLRQGKKRKRAGPRNEERSAAPATIKGTSKVTKFDDDIDDSSTLLQETDRDEQSGVDAVVTEELGRAAKEIPNRPHKRHNPHMSSKPSDMNSKSQRPDRTNSRHPGNSQRPNSGDALPQHLIRKRDALLLVRKSLPIWPQADAIKASLKRNNVLVLTGETGSGKSTQVPQFLTNEPWCSKCIAITQPRRVAAISLARRVAEEMGTFMGSQSPTAKVGYSVRFDNATGPDTKIKFLTEGMLLQEMLRDPAMSQYSAIVVDEVHERSVNVDLILGFLKNLVADMESGGSKRKDPLKVVIMSATADVDSLVEFFGNNPNSSPPTTQAKDERQISTCFVEGRQYPVKTVYLPEPAQDWVEAALKIIFQIHYKEPLPGDILVFLTGQDTIEGLEKLVNDYAEGMDKDVPKVSFCTERPYLHIMKLTLLLASCITTLCCTSTTCPTTHLSAHAFPYSQGYPRY
jgi:ATP-dependent RNA helicase DHR2